MALLQILLPGAGGQVGALISDTLALLETAASCGPEDPLSCMVAIIDLVFVTFDLFQLLFPGRPKVGPDSATDHIALFYIPSANPVTALYGIGVRELETVGVTLSSRSGPGYVAEQNLAAAFKADLIKQFDGPKAPKLTLKGVPVTGALVHQWYFQLGFANPNPDSDRVAIYERTLVDDLYTQLVNQKYIDPKTGFPVKPPPGGCPAGQYWDGTKCAPIPHCPAGQHWDGTRCVPDLPPPPPPPGGQPDQDEFQDCCDETQAALAALNQSIGLLAQGGVSGGVDTACCDKVVVAIGGVSRELTMILSPLSKLAAGGTDLAPIVTELAKLVAAISGLKGVDLSAVVAELKGIAEKLNPLAEQKPIDVSGIQKALEEANKLQDVPQAIIDQLIQDGSMDPEIGQLVQGAAVARVRSTSAVSDVINLLGKLNKFLGGGPAPKTITAESVSGTISEGTKALFEKTFNASKRVFGPVITGILNAHNAEISKLRNVAPCAERPGAANLLTEAIGAAVAAHFASVAVETVYPTKNLGFEKVADVIAAIAGIEDIIGGLIGVEIQQLIAIPHRYCINEQGRTILPGMGDAGSLHSRGLISDAQAQQLLAYNGLASEYAAPTLTAAYSGIAPRQLLRLMNTGLFTDADYREELDFAGLRQSSQHRYLLAAPYLATASERNQLRAEYEKGYGAGLLTDKDLVDLIDSAEHNTSRDLLILDKVRMTERIELAKALTTEYTTMYKAGLLAHDAYVANLQGIGLQDWKVNAVVGIADANRAATMARQMAAAERALERATAAAARKAAMKSYVDGVIDVVALSAALVATGLTAAQAAAWTELAVLEKRGGLRWVYGVQLPQAQATLLKGRVTALMDQHRKKLIDDAALLREFGQLGIPPVWQNALLAQADAVLSGKGAAKLVPVSTQ